MITDYASLAAAIASHTNRDDLDGDIPRFVQMTEVYLQRRLRTLDMETQAYSLVSDEEVTVPADLLSIRSIYMEGEPELPLTAVSPAALAGEFQGMQGTPSAYSLTGNTIRLSPKPAEEVNLTITYLAKFTPLTENTDNWIIRNHPDVYFYGTLAQAMLFLKDPDAAAIGSVFEAAVNNLATSRAMDRWGPGLTIPTGVRQVAGARC